MPSPLVGPFTRLPRPPATDDKRQWGMWFDKIHMILAGMPGIEWAIVDKRGSHLSDLETRPHSELTNVLQADDTSTSTALEKHVTDAQVKVYGDHVRTTNANPHGTDHSMLDALTADDHSQYLLLAGRAGQRSVTPLSLGGATNKATVEADGTIFLEGDATGWRDENFSGAVSSIGPSAATLVNWDTSSILVPSFPHNITKELQLIREYDHAGKVAASITPHAHLLPSDTSVGTAKFFLEYYIKNDGLASLSGTLNATLTTGGTAWEELRLSFPAITSVLLTQGCQIGMRLYRLSTDAGTYAHPVAVATWGYHYEIDTPAGSRGMTTK